MQSWGIDSDGATEELGQGRNFTEFLGVSEVTLQKLLVCDLLFFSTSSSPMVLGPVHCPAEIHCTTVFALRHGHFAWCG